MLKILTCPRGHRWGYAGPAHQPTCPICGGRSVPSREGSDTRVVPHSALTTVVNAGANADNPRLPSDERVTLALPSAAPAEVDEYPTLELNAEATVEYADGSQDSVAPPQITDYEVLRELGRGGMGVVYQAIQKSLKRTVALKMILAGVHAGPVDRRRFHREAEAIARLEHPNIVKIYEVGEAEGRPFLSLEYVDGGSLAQRLTGTPLPPRQAARLIALLSQAIETAHQQGFVHRDLKPANILLSTSRSKSPAGTASAESVDSCHAWLNCIPKITDFGLAKELDNGAAQTRSGTIMGTPCYMAPEQTTGHGASIRPATDVYALGAILYELLTGRPPFQGQTPLDTLNQVQADDPVPPRRLQSKLAVDLETICLKCLQKDPNRRYGRAALLADDLNQFLAGRPVAARPIPVWERLAKYSRRKPALVALLMVSAAAFLLSIIGVIWHTISLQQALNTADELRVTAQSERDRALAQERLVREYMYGADVQLAQALIKNADVRQAVELLGKYRPEAGEDDIREFTWHYLWRLCQGDQRTLTGHTKDVYFVTFSPDGKLLATAGEDGRVRLFNTSTWELQTTLIAHRDEVNWAEFSADGRRLATASDDGTVRVWDVASGRELFQLPVSDKHVIAAVFAPSGDLLATAGADTDIQLWELRTQQQVATLKAHTKLVESMAFSPDGRTLASCSMDGRVILWDVAQRGKRCQLTDGEPVGCKFIAYSPDGKWIGTGHTDGSLRIWDAAKSKLVHARKGHSESLQCLAFSPDSLTIATGGDDSIVQTWDVATGQSRHKLRGHTQRVWSVAYAPDGRTIASGSRDRTVKLWDPTPREVWSSLTKAGSPAIALSALNKETLLLGRADGRVEKWDLENGRLAAQTMSPLASKDISLYASDRTGEWIARILPNRVQLWHTPDQMLRVPDKEIRTGTAAALSSEGRYLALQLPNKCIQIIDTDAPESPVALKNEGSDMLSAAFSPDGRLLATGHRDQSIALWDVQGGRRRGLLFGHKGEVTCLAFSPDGRTLASGSTDKTAKLWDPESGEERGSLLGHTMLVRSLAFSPDGQTLATGCDDAFVRLWSVRTSLLLADLDKHSGPIQAAIFTPDGETLVSSAQGPDGKAEIRLWQSLLRVSSASNVISRSE